MDTAFKTTALVILVLNRYDADVQLLIESISTCE